MTNQEILTMLGSVKKGRYVKLTKTKDLGNGLVKESDMRIRLGVAYSNMSINEGRQTAPLAWGKWVAGLENIALEHKGNYYLRISSTNPEHLEESKDVIATRYLLNNQEISKEEASVLIGDKKTSKPSPVYNIKFENIKSLTI